MEPYASIIQLVANAATAISIVLAVVQLYRDATTRKSEFIESVERDYRDLIKEIPYQVFLGKLLTVDEQAKTMDDFYRYFDLTNNQVMLRQHKKISRDTWENWSAGAKNNLSLPAFRAAYKEIVEPWPTQFTEMQQLVREDFVRDPAEKGWKGQPQIALPTGGIALRHGN
ncbi:MAG: hypothetical protein WCG80_19550 [Spirochaetales bacterium]